ncbi:MAG TPA: glycosyltransferase family 4 protein [Euzebyales bacterium]|nr:glycosyltransferase family 4 protein [Euzebyales bacterium]
MDAAGPAGYPERLRRRSLFLVWGPPSHGPRSKVFARALGIDVVFLHATRRRGLLVAPWKYAYQAVATVALLARRRPRVVLVQSPPSIAVAVVWAYAALSGARFVVDAHSAALDTWYWARPAWLHGFLARRAAATIVTNEHFAARIRAQGGHAVVVHDIPATFTIGDPPPLADGFRIVVVNTFAPDEPLDEILAAAAEVPDVTFYVTGDLARPGARSPNGAPPNVRFTGFIADEAYFGLMDAADAVLCLTTRDHTMQRGACEALSMGRPIITSDWPLLRSYFRLGTVHVATDAAAIRDGIERLVRDHEHYRRGIRELRTEQARQWEAARTALLAALRA